MTEKTLEARRPAKRSSFKVTKTGKAAVPITLLAGTSTKVRATTTSRRGKCTGMTPRRFRAATP